MTPARAIIFAQRYVTLNLAQAEMLAQTVSAYGGADVKCYLGGEVQIIPPPMGRRVITVWPAPVEIPVEK
jgi:hypothetical protein